MGLSVYNNVEAMNAHRVLTNTEQAALQVDGASVERSPHQPRCR